MRFPWPIGICAALAWCACMSAQLPLDPERFPELVSLLDANASAEPAFSCSVHPLPPHLNFDFRFQAGYSLSVPLKAYSGAGKGFSTVIRITPHEPDLHPIYLAQTVNLPEIPAKTRAEMQLAGGYFLGEGKYTMDLLLVDQAGRSCRKHWRTEVKRSGGNRSIPIAISSGHVAPFRFDTWKGISEHHKTDLSHPLRLTVLFHVAPLFRRSTSLRAYDQEMLLSSLASILEQIPYTQLKLVAFNLDQQMELFRQDNFDSDGWDKLLEAMEKLQLAKVSYDVLAHRSGHVDLLRKLIDEELAATGRSDAVIFLGPTARQSDKPAILPHRDAMAQPLFFYFEYKPYWFRGPDFPDVVYHMTRALAGKVFRIHSPSEFASAIRAVRASLEQSE